MKKIFAQLNNTLKMKTLWPWAVGFLAFFWILFRSGLNPGRLSYPCQRAAMPIAVNWVLAIIAFFAGGVFLKRFTRFSLGALSIGGIAWLILSIPGSTRSDDYSQASYPVWESDNPISTVYVMDSLPPANGSLSAGDASIPDEYLSDPAMDTLLAMMETDDYIHLYRTGEHPDGIVGADNVVIIKGNYQWTSRNTTSADRVKGLIWKILQHPDGFSGEILVCDNTQNFGTGINDNDNNSDDPEQSVVDVVNTFDAKGYPVYFLDWAYLWEVVADEYSTGDYTDGYVYNDVTKVSYPKFLSPSGEQYISAKYGIWNVATSQYDQDRLCVIDFPVVKAHAMAGATLAVKNWIGLLTTGFPNERYGGWSPMHYTYFWGAHALTARVIEEIFPRLTIIDGTWTSPVNANDLADTVKTNVMLASIDPLAASWYAAKYILTPVADQPNYTNPDLPGGQYTYFNTINIWADYLRNTAGLPCTRDSAEISVYDRYFSRKRITFAGDEFRDDIGGDGDGIPEAGETVQYIMSFVNTNDFQVNDVTIDVLIDDPTLNIVNSSAILGNIPSGDTANNESEPITIEIPAEYAPRANTLHCTISWNAGSESRSIIFDKPIGGVSILLVDDDDGDLLEQYVTAYLNDLLIPHEIYANTPEDYPDSLYLSNYDIVIWMTGDYRPTPISGDEVEALRGYLNSAGKLFLTGQRIAAQLDIDNPVFLHDYLRSEFLSTLATPVLNSVPGCQVMETYDSVLIHGAGGASNQSGPDHISPINGGIGELQYLGTTDYGAVSYVGDYDLLFFSFGVEAIVNGSGRWTDRDVIVSRILEFFDYQSPICPLTLDLDAPALHLTDHTPDISWQYCDDQSGAQEMYHLQVGEDNDWTAAELWDYGPVSGSETTVTYAGAELVDGETYYIRMQVFDGGLWSPWHYFQMRMNSKPSVPTDLSPDNMEEVAGGALELSNINSLDNEGDVLTYTYEVYDDNLMTNLVAQTQLHPEAPGGLTFWTVSPDLPDNEDYFWRVCANDGYESGQWSHLASFRVKAVFICGDAGGDGEVNVGDAVFLINYIFKGGPAPDPLEAGDANCDGQVNVGDAVYLIAYVFKGGPEPCCP
jgi:hypothetical protein